MATNKTIADTAADLRLMATPMLIELAAWICRNIARSRTLAELESTLRHAANSVRELRK